MSSSSSSRIKKMTKKMTFEEVELKINNSSLSSESKAIYKIMMDMFKSISIDKDSMITQLKQLVEDNRSKMDAKISSWELSMDKMRKELTDEKSLVEIELDKFKKELSAEKLMNKKLSSQLITSQNAHDELEAYGRRESLVFSGDVVKPAQSNEDCCLIARDIIKNNLKIQKDPLISTAHRIGKPPATNSSAPDKRGIIVKFVQRDDKFRIMKAAKEIKISGLYVNESLTATRSKILNVLRQCRKMRNGLVTGTSTHNGRVFAYTKPAPNAPEGSRSIRTEINTEEHLADFCSNFMKKPLDTFLDKFGKKIF